MRKGRSSRRSRISRPLVSVKGEALSTDVGPASSGHLSPRVVVGIPPSDPPPSEALDTPPPVVLEAKAPSRSGGQLLRGSIVDREEHLPPPPSEPPVDEPIAKSEANLEEPSSPEVLTTGWTAPPPPVVDAPKVEEQVSVVAPKVEEKLPEPVAVVEAAVVAPEPAAISAPDPFKSTVVFGSSEAAKVEVAAEPEPPKPTVSFAKTLAFGSKTELPQSERIEAPRERNDARERLKTQRMQAQETQKAISPKEDPDEISVPPANDLNIEDEKFFSEAEIAVRKSVHEFELMAAQEAEAHVSEKARRKLDPHVIRRRERFAGYVKVAVAGAAIVCLAAVGRSAIHSRTKPAATPAVAVAVAEAPVTPKAAEPAAAPKVDPVAETKPAEPAPAPAPDSETKPAEAEAKPTEPAAEPSKAEVIAGDAKEELKKSRVALEKRKIADAIEAGERSVTLDPTDGEAWLILGAAYQEKGDMVNARRCYGSCVKQGKSGPRLECQKMLRF